MRSLLTPSLIITYLSHPELLRVKSIGPIFDRSQIQICLLTLGLMKQTLRTQIPCSNKDKTELAHK